MRIVLIESDYFTQREIKNALTKEGHDVFSLFIDYRQPISVWAYRLFSTIMNCSVELVISVNHFGFDKMGHVGDLLEKCNIPVAIWYVDSPTFTLKDTKFSGQNVSTIFLWEKALAPYMKNYGTKFVEYLPLAADLDTFLTNELPNPDGPVVFVGNSMVVSKNKHIKYLSKSGQELAEELSNEFLLGKRFDNLIKEEIEVPVGDNVWDIWALAVWSATQKRRVELVNSIEGIHVYGDDHWKEVAPNAIFCGEVKYGKGSSKVFREASIVINSTSYQMPTAVNQRVFDVPLSNGFVLSDNQEALGELFSMGDEAVSYLDLDDLKKKVRLYKGEFKERRRITENAKKRIIVDHTYEKRLQILIEKACNNVISCIDYGPIEKLLGPPKAV